MAGTKSLCRAKRQEPTGARARNPRTAVRTELYRASPDKAQVSDILADFGFWHFGQFAKDYREAFGERPSDTLRRSSVPQRTANKARGA